MYLLQFDWWIFLEKLILIAVIVTTALVVAMYSTYAERRIAAFLQDRRGPNRAGPFGLPETINIFFIPVFLLFIPFFLQTLTRHHFILFSTLFLKSIIFTTF